MKTSQLGWKEVQGLWGRNSGLLRVQLLLETEAKVVPRGTCEDRLLKGARAKIKTAVGQCPGAGKQEESGSSSGVSQETCSATRSLWDFVKTVNLSCIVFTCNLGPNQLQATSPVMRFPGHNGHGSVLQTKIGGM